MNLKRFIKVTPRDSEKFIVILAANRDFYLSQGAKVEQPTEEEVLEFFPQMEKELNKYCKHHRSVNFDALKTSDIKKLVRIYNYFDNNKHYIHEWEGGVRCDERGMKLHFWVNDDPNYLVIHISSNHNNLALSGSTSWIIKAPTLEDKVNTILTIKKDISKIVKED